MDYRFFYLRDNDVIYFIDISSCKCNNMVIVFFKNFMVVVFDVKLRIISIININLIFVVCVIYSFLIGV